MISLEEIKKELLEGKEIEEVVKNIDWQDFEKLVSEILEKHGFKTWNNFRFKTERRYEIDVIASNNDMLLLIDCKQWDRGRYKSSALRESVGKQEERLLQFKKFLKNNPIARNNFLIKKRRKIMSCIVTWYQEELIEYSKSWVVPIWKFNDFLLDLGKYS
jgi:Holliday junction resolvase-like predicted endonuclease